MKLLVKIIWVLATLTSLTSVLWYIVGTTAYFQRDIDIISTFILMYFGIPSILLVVLSIICFIKGWYPTTLFAYLSWVLLICCMFALTPMLVKSVDTQGWLTENITSDSLQVTDDDKYEYRLELINLFQENSHARLYLKNKNDGNVILVPLDLPIQQIKVLDMNSVNHWISLMPGEDSDLYILRTESKFPLPQVVFRVDTRQGNAIKISEYEIPEPK
ncbi:hypothetical protein [Paenibacillus sp. QZ-Y1]|uniref:hypothetical protein n=1 Tax=Paenibacillus sp. QZ-Y1 TaxID=3414511 RepID=UPI003F795B5E